MKSGSPRAVVTGASGAIGREIARHLIRDNWTVIGTYHRHPERLPDDCLGRKINFLRDEGLDQSIRNIGREFNPLRLIVHSAGNLDDATIANLDREQWTRVRRVHLDGTYRLARNLRKHLQQDANTPTHFLVVSSLVGLRGGYGQANYAAAKAGQLGLVMSLAREWKPDVNVNVIRPPWTRSDMTDNVGDSAPGDGGDPERTARYIHHIADEPDVTGQVLSVDNRIRGPWQ